MGRTGRTLAISATAALLTLTAPAAAQAATDTAATTKATTKTTTKATFRATPNATTSPTPRIDLRVLVLDDGGPVTAAITAELDSEGTPYTKVDLTSANRPTIDAAFLSDITDGQPRAKFQAVVSPNDDPFAAGSAEMSALAAYEQQFQIRQIDAYTYARPQVGLDYAQNSGYIGPLDGDTAQVTTAGLAGAFGYLRGSVPFEDNSPTVAESYGYVAQPLGQQAPGATFTPLVDMAVPGSPAARGSLVGEYDHDGRSELVVTFAYNQYQEQFRLLARGMVEWVTRGVHLGAARNYFSVNVDDVLLADDRWNTQLKCTPGDVDCAPGTGADANSIRMTAADAQYAKQWSQANGLTFDFVFNGGGSDDYAQDNGGSDPLAQQLVGDKDAYRWVNHTYSHEFLGCVQNVTVVPWQCTTDSSGAVTWVPQSTITSQIDQNRQWAAAHGIPLQDDELVTGEHSGLKLLPQQPQDNPNLAPALTATGVKWIASDTSREPRQRQAGPALTVPRTPMNVFYNAGHVNEEVDEYNWIYTSKAAGGSGLCESSGSSSCLPAPLDTTTGYASYIVPLEARIDLGHVLSNNPSPHFIHQSNLAEDRIAYPVLDAVLGQYRALFADDTPFVDLRLSDIGAELQRRAAWQAAVAGGSVTAYLVGDTVTVEAPDGVAVPATMPDGTRQDQLIGSSAFGGGYAGALSGWATPGLLQSSVTLELPAPSAPALVRPQTVSAVRVQAPAPRSRVPDGVRRAVPYGPGDVRAVRPAAAPRTRR